MLGMIDWAADRARMVLAFVILTLAAGVLAYTGLPKEGEPDIEVPALFISVPFQGISAADSETLLVRPMEQELAGLDNLVEMTATAAQGYAGVVLEFEFGWDKPAVIAVLGHLAQNAKAHGATQLRILKVPHGIEVCDNGSGIAQGNRDRIFDPFFTTRRGNGGTGMGLAIVETMLGAAGGSITLLPTEKGTGFRITFPS